MYAQLLQDIEHDFQSPVQANNIVHAEHLFGYGKIDENNLKVVYVENKIKTYIESGNVNERELEQARIKMEELQLQVARNNLPKLWPDILRMVEEAEAAAEKRLKKKN